MKRLHWIDCVKGLAMILVVLGHIDMGGHFLCVWLYSFHVPLFFVISGVLLAVGENKEAASAVPAVILKKGKQLLYPYFVFSLLVILYLGIRGLGGELALALRDTVCFNGYSTLWFLPALFFGECIFLLLHHSKIPDLAGSVLLFLLTLLLSLCNNGVTETASVGIGSILLNLFNRTCIAAVFLFLGYHAFRLSQNCPQPSRRIMLAVGIALFCFHLTVCAANGWADMHFCKVNNPFLYYLLACTGSLSIILLMQNGIRKCRVLEYFGKNSLIVLVTHLPFPIVGYARKAWEMLPCDTGIRYVDDLAVCVIVLITEVILIEVINRFVPFLISIPGPGTKRSL